MPIWMIVIEWLARGILLGLFGLSVWSVAIILERKRAFRNADLENFVSDLKKKAKGYPTKTVEKALSKELFLKKKSLEGRLNILGTLGSTTPFIGLLGTILGIIVAFGELSMGTADTNAIMYALAEALILTAVGLFVAIPAVIAFNIFKKKSYSFFAEVQSEMDGYLAERHDS